MAAGQEQLRSPCAGSQPDSGAASGSVAEPSPIAPARPSWPSSWLNALFPALAVPGFRLLQLGNFPSTLSWQTSMVAVGYATLHISGSATALGIVSSANGLPMVLFSLVGGVVADRVSRRRLLLTTQSLLGLSSIALAALAVTGILQVWHLAILGLIQGTTFAFNMPTRQALIAELVGPRLLRNAVAIHISAVNLSRVAGPALAGVLLSVPWLGISGVFVLMAALYIPVVLCFYYLPRTPAAASSDPKRSGWADLAEGLRYVRSSPVLVVLLLVAFVTILFGLPFLQLMPLFSERVFDVGAAGLGALMAANGIGALAGSLSVAAFSNARRLSWLQIGFGLGFGASLVGFALAPHFVLAVGVLGVVGFTSAAYTSINNSLIVSHADPRLYGRVMSLVLLTFALTPIAALPMAWLADQIGPRATVAGAGVVVFGVILGVAALYPPFRRIR